MANTSTRGLKDMVFDTKQGKWVKKPGERTRIKRGNGAAKTQGKPTCNAKLTKRGQGHCSLGAGWGTDHPGIGACKFHGGAMPNHVKAAATQELRTLLGKPIDINPYEAIMWCIRIRGGEVQWLTDKIAELKSESSWTEENNFGQRELNIWARERKEAMADLVRFSQIAISLGIAERAVRLAEVYGETISVLISGIMNELSPYMNDEGRALIPAVVRRHVLAMESGAHTLEQKAITAGDVAA